jgi:putative chitinase
VALTAETLMAATGCSESDAAVFVEPFNIALDRFGISTRQQVAAFLAQTAHESARFTTLVENLNYSADGLANTWPSRYGKRAPAGGYVWRTVNGRRRIEPSALALSLHRQPEKIANLTYANRNGNGPVETGDGWRFRGRGVIQTTGRANYERAGAALGINLLAEPDALESPLYAVLSAGVFWTDNKLNLIAGDVVAVTRRINGGDNGLADRRNLTNDALRVLA